MSEPAATACGFTLAHYREILERALKLGYEILRLQDAERLTPGRRQMILRHDIDFSIDAARRMARLETQLGVRATYGVLLHSPTYSVDDPAVVSVLRELREWGHELALHYDCRFFEALGLDPLDGIRWEAERLERLVGTAVRSVAQHRPAAHGQFAPPRDRARFPWIDAYDPALTREIVYLSDSRRRWRQGCVHLHLPAVERMQLLIHPLWWIDDGEPDDRRGILRRIVERYAGAVAAQVEAYADELDRG